MDPIYTPNGDYEDKQHLVEASEGDGAPSQVSDFMQKHGIPSNSYECAITKFNYGTQEWEFLCRRRNNHESPEDLGERYGSGKYKWTFTFQADGPLNAKKKVTRDMDLVLGSHFDAIHAEWKVKQEELASIREIDRLKTEARRNAALGVSNNETPEKLMNQIDKMATVLQKFGVNINQPKEDGGGKMLELVLAQMNQSRADMQAMMQMQSNQANENQKLMVTMMTALIGPMMTAVSTKNQPREGENPMNQLMQMAQFMSGVFEKKMEIENPTPPETTVDKVLGLLAESIPLVMQWASQSPEKRAKSLAYRAAMNSPEMNAIKKDGAALEQLINGSDARFGTSVTDATLKAGGLTRPDHLKSNYEKYPATVDEDEFEGDEDGQE